MLVTDQAEGSADRLGSPQTDPHNTVHSSPTQEQRPSLTKTAGTTGRPRSVRRIHTQTSHPSQKRPHGGPRISEQNAKPQNSWRRTGKTQGTLGLAMPF